MANNVSRKGRKPAKRKTIKKRRVIIAKLLIGISLIELALDLIFHISPTFAIVGLISGIIYYLAK